MGEKSQIEELVNNGIKSQRRVITEEACVQERGNREFTILRKYFVIFGSLTISMLLNAVFGCGFSYRSCLVVVSQYL